MKDDQGAKYINSPDTPVYTKGHHLFGLQLTRNAIAKKDFAIVVEGYMDMIIPFQHGVDNIVASLGTALTVEQIRLLRRYTNNIVMLFDADKAGQAAIVRSLDLLIEQEMNVRVAKLATDEDPDSFIRKFGVAEFDKCIQNAQTLFDFKLQWLMAQLDSKNIEQRAEICNQMLATLYKIKNEVVRFGYIRQLAERLGLPEQVLMNEGKKIESSSYSKERTEQKQQPKPLAAQPVNPVELHLLTLLVHDPDLIAYTKAKMLPSELSDGRIRAIVEKLYELNDAEADISVASFLNYFDDPQLQRIILNISAQEAPPGNAPVKILEDCILRVKKDQLKAKRQNLSQLIHQAEVSGDAQRLEQLKEEFNQLIKS
jgi:DNA primase